MALEPLIQPVIADNGNTAQGFLQRLESILVDLVVLKVATVVDDVYVTGSGAQTTVSAIAGPQAEAASSDIDLLNGHVTNTFSKGFAGLGDGSLQSFHQTQVEKSNAILLANLAELQTLASSLLSRR